MRSGNHLTIRDYFDQAIIGNRQSGKTFSRSAENRGPSGTRSFHRMLKSHQMPGARDTGVQSTGLKISDYLANRLPARSQYRRQINAPSTEPKAVEPHTSPPPATTKGLPENKMQSFQSVVKRLQSPGKSVPLVSHEPSASRERQKIEKSIQKAAGKYNLSPQLIKGVIRAESNFKVDAVSRAGAQGLMQLMPATAKELGVKKPFDIDQNIDGGSRYLRKMLDSFDGNVKLALAAYNAGPGNVRKYDGNVPFQETIQYVDRVLRYSEQSA